MNWFRRWERNCLNSVQENLSRNLPADHRINIISQTTSKCDPQKSRSRSYNSNTYSTDYATKSWDDPIKWISGTSVTRHSSYWQRAASLHSRCKTQRLKNMKRTTAVALSDYRVLGVWNALKQPCIYSWLGNRSAFHCSHLGAINQVRASSGFFKPRLDFFVLVEKLWHN